MANQVTIGGDRLGSGQKEKVNLRTFDRTTHDLGYNWKSTMAPGTLIPFMSEVMLPGDTFEVNLSADALTLPTIGPLFGSFKFQVDVFKVPIRLYQGDLHMNRVKIGLKMQDIRLPQVWLEAPALTAVGDIDNKHINPSAIWSYLNIRGLGYETSGAGVIGRHFNAVPWLAYWDIYKNYYANKQEDIGVVIHNNLEMVENNVEEVYITLGDGVVEELENYGPHKSELMINMLSNNVEIKIHMENYIDFDLSRFEIAVVVGDPGLETIRVAWVRLTDFFEDIVIDQQTRTIVGKGLIYRQEIREYYRNGGSQVTGYREQIFVQGYRFNIEPRVNEIIEPRLVTFPLENIDTMREDILKAVGGNGVVINSATQGVGSYEPYNLPKGVKNVMGNLRTPMESGLEGIACKTYQSDLFNNWISTEWIDGDNGVNELTKIITDEGSFTLDTLNLSQKLYNMLNSIAISGGSYKDWIQAVYSQEKFQGIEEPVYVGGLIKEISFQQVISNASATGEPLGTLAGRGGMTSKNKGGHIKVSTDEHAYLIGIVSITPRIDYSQGNKWDTNLKNMDDFHKPHLDAIGFQDLITDQMAWFDTVADTAIPEFKSAGKQPAWINYMTNVDVVRGNFARQSDQMFMVLNRRYEAEWKENGDIGIRDLTTYIDPSKFNHIFADTRRDAQNFWVQIKTGLKARRKMSAKVIPNL